jgi:hypothetical protein
MFDTDAHARDSTIAPLFGWRQFTLTRLFFGW